MCLMERIRVLDKLLSQVSYSAAACELTVNELTIYIKLGVFQWKHT